MDDKVTHPCTHGLRTACEFCDNPTCDSRQAQEAPKADKAIDDMDCATCPDQGSSACFRCDGVGKSPKAASQSAEELAEKILQDNVDFENETYDIRGASDYIEADRAAQRQAGREEVYQSIRNAVRDDWKQPGMSLIRVCHVIDKALSDLDEARKG